MLKDARWRSSRDGIPFALSADDISIPKVCPVLGLRLKTSRGRAGPCSPSLDRIVPERGYVPSNVIVVSHRANEIRRDATVKELRMLYQFYRKACAGRRS